jgi:type IV secretory pathway VirB10-like protein
MCGLSFIRGHQARHALFNFHYSSLHVKALVLSSICIFPLTGVAQDEAFLLCANLTDRAARVSCLENALERAVEERDAGQAQPAAPAAAVQTPQPQQQAPAVRAAAPAAPAPATTAEAAQEESRGFDLFGLFERERDEEAEKEQQAANTMHAKVAELDFYKPDVLTITLDNGQIWRQLYARRHNLREGDAISIYQSGWGKQFRLEAERFNGFIQVERLR